jgi:hypothetical protein
MAPPTWGFATSLRTAGPIFKFWRSKPPPEAVGAVIGFFMLLKTWFFSKNFCIAPFFFLRLRCIMLNTPFLVWVS